MKKSLFLNISGDGIYDKLSTKEVVDTVWNSTKENLGDNIHQACATAVENIMKAAISKRTVDNITVVMIAFSSFKNFLFPKKLELIGHNSLDNIDIGRKQYILENSLVGNNSFDLDNRSFSLGEELSIVNQNVVDINTNGSSTNKQNAPTNVKPLLNKRGVQPKKKPNIIITAASSRPNVSSSINTSSQLDKSKMGINVMNVSHNGVNFAKVNAPKGSANFSNGVRKPEMAYTSRGLTKNTETFYKKNDMLRK